MTTDVGTRQRAATSTMSGEAGAHRRAPARRLGKRLFDIAVAAVIMCALLPVFVVVSLLVVLTSRGGAIYRQERIGRGGVPFVMFKFRTMRAGCSDALHREYVVRLLTDDTPPVGGANGMYKLEADPRVTGVGRILRRTSLDELPQLWNVLTGDMSLVGPRPALPWEAEMFSATHRERFRVPPGLTGLWQVSGRSKIAMRDGLDLDVEYVRRQSFRLDLVILLKTVPAVIAAVGAP
ncbi:MAG TPA: sugar transferase [Jatrophihabitans sp.]|nr:sugar transferase [Jatrophihabitans sp.]